MELNLKLTVDEINYLLQSLGARPYGEVKSLIEKIKGDAEAQIAAASQPATVEADTVQ